MLMHGKTNLQNSIISFLILKCVEGIFLLISFQLGMKVKSIGLIDFYNYLNLKQNKSI